jgi:hypothetical protein
VNRTSKNYAALAAARAEWVKALENQGVQFRFLATPQIEAGELEKYKVLILPWSIALSDAELRAIERFRERGGIVYADEQTGRMDEHCRWRRTAVLTSGVRRQPPGPIDIRPAFPLDGQFLTTIRDFGAARLVGLLPPEPQKVTLPAPGRVRYDLLRGSLAASVMEASPSEPVLLVERDKRIDRVELSAELEVRLFEEGGTPVDRSVVRLEVFDPSGKLVRHYSGNVTVNDGRAQFAIPFAMNDAPGQWQVRARDVISGLSASRSLQWGPHRASHPPAPRP